MLNRITVFIEEDERVALEKWAAQEMRGLRDQIRFVLREVIQQRGLLLPEQAYEQKTDKSHA